MSPLNPSVPLSFMNHSPKKSVDLPLQCSRFWGGKCHPMHKLPWATLLQHSCLLRDFIQQGQLMAVGRQNVISHSREKHHRSFKSQVICWSGGFPSAAAVPSFDQGPRPKCSASPSISLGWDQALSKNSATGWGIRRSSASRRSTLPGSRPQPLAPTPAIGPGPGPSLGLALWWGHSFFFSFFFPPPPSGWKSNKRQWSQKMLVFKQSRNWELDNNSATTESIQPSGGCDTSKKGWCREGGRDLKNEGFHCMLKCILHAGCCFHVEQRKSLSGFVHQRRTYWNT